MTAKEFYEKLLDFYPLSITNFISNRSHVWHKCYFQDIAKTEEEATENLYHKIRNKIPKNKELIIIDKLTVIPNGLNFLAQFNVQVDHSNYDVV